MKVCKAEHGLVIPLPDDVAQRLGISEGDDVGIVPVSKATEMPQAEIDKVFAEIRKLRGRAPSGYTFKRSDAYEHGDY